MIESEDILKRFAERLYTYRKKYGFSQEELGQKIMYTGKAVSKWEKGVTLPPTTVLVSLADLFNTTIDDLLDYCSHPTYYLGIDGGGSKTAFCLADEKGNILKNYILGASNPLDIGFERATSILNEGILEITKGIPRRQISMFAGIAGGGTEPTRTKLKNFFENYGFFKTENDSDSKSILFAGLGQSDGMIVIMGTGSSAFVQKEGQVSRIGGLGYLFDHGGCGYDIGNAAIRASCKMEEGSQENTTIRKYLLQQLGTETVLEKLTYFYSIGKSGIASYCRTVFEAYKKDGDFIAEKILRENMMCVAQLIATGGKKLMSGKLEEKIKVVFVGGLINEWEILKSFLFSELAKIDDVSRYDIALYDKCAVYGALLCAGMPRS